MKETVSQPRAAKADWTLEVTELCIYTNKNGRCYCLKWFSALKVWQLPNFCGGPCQTFVVAHAKLLFHKTRYPEWAKILAIAKLMWKIPNNFRNINFLKKLSLFLWNSLNMTGFLLTGQFYSRFEWDSVFLPLLHVLWCCMHFSVEWYYLYHYDDLIWILFFKKTIDT